MSRKSLEERFWEKVDVRGADECWLWKNCRNPHGYGCFHLHGRRVLAHRLAFKLAGGVIPAGLCVCHHCDRRACCNPAHLFVGSITDNDADMVRKGRNALPPYVRGEQHGASKLTETQVREIRARYAMGNVTQASLAKEYGIVPPTVRHIVCRKTWAWLD